MLKNYEWGDVYYPTFRPNEDTLFPGRYVLEGSITCYPYARGDKFDPAAYPPSIRERAVNSHDTNFYFLVRDENGYVFEGLEWDECCELADRYNNSYHEKFMECCDNWNWNEVPFEIDWDDVVFNK